MKFIFSVLMCFFTFVTLLTADAIGENHVLPVSGELIEADLTLSRGENIITLTGLNEGDNYVFYWYSDEDWADELSLVLDDGQIDVVHEMGGEVIFNANADFAEFIFDSDDIQDGSELSIYVWNRSETRRNPVSHPTSVEEALDPIVIDTSRLPEDLVINEFVNSSCIEVTNISFLGDIGRGIGAFDNAEDIIGFESGIVLSTGAASTISGPNLLDNDFIFDEDELGGMFDTDLEQVAGFESRDAQVLSFSFVAPSDSLSFDYVFASEEYCEFIISTFNDVFGFFISGPGISGPFSNSAINIATIPGTTDPVAIQTVNFSTNGAFYVDNIDSVQMQDLMGGCVEEEVGNEAAAPQDIIFDGFTVPLTASIGGLIPCEEYTIKLAISDIFDNAYGSAVFLRSNSFDFGESLIVDVNYTSENGEQGLEGCDQSEICLNFSRGGQSDISAPYITPLIFLDSLSTATPGVDFENLPDTIVIPAGETEVEICFSILEDDLVEGIESATFGVLSSCLCDDTITGGPETFEFFINDVQGLEVDLISEVSACFGETINLTPEILSGNPEYQFTWSDENGVFSSERDIEYVVGDETNLTFSVIDACGQQIDLQVEVVAVDQLEATVVADDPCTSGNICRELTFDFGQGSNFEIFYELNGQEFSVEADTSFFVFELCDEGEYVFTGFSQNECSGNLEGDTIVVVDPESVEVEVYYDFDDCNASTGETADYGEFTPELTCVLPCSDLIASTVFRDPANQFRHSCTPGQEGAAICVGSLDDCNYTPGSEYSIVFEISVEPEVNTFVNLESLSFFERAPENYNWIGGESGPNNYPTLYGLRITVNNVQVFVSPSNPTETEWNLEAFDFEDIQVNQNSVIRFELLPYCLIGNGEPVDAWDIDELNLVMTCSNDPSGNITGSVSDLNGAGVSDVLVNISTLGIQFASEHTGVEGEFGFEDLDVQADYTIEAVSNEAFLQPSVSSMDLLLIQKHLLGLEEFDEVSQYVAADLSGDAVISVTDIIMLREAILGMNDSQQSWKYISDYRSLTLGDPFGFDESPTVGLWEDGDTEDIELTSIKMGDVSGESYSAGLSELDSRERNDAMPIRVHSDRGNWSLMLEEGAKVEGLQLVFDISDAQDVQILSELWNSALINYGINGNQMIVSVIGKNALSLESGQELLRINGISELSSVSMTSSGLKSEIYTLDDMGVSVAREIDFVSDYTVSEEALEVMVQPNPFNAELQVSLTNAKAGEVILSIHDIQGQEQARHYQTAISGENLYYWNPGLVNPGLYYLQIRNEGEIIGVQKLVFIQ